MSPSREGFDAVEEQLNILLQCQDGRIGKGQTQSILNQVECILNSIFSMLLWTDSGLTNALKFSECL